MKNNELKSIRIVLNCFHSCRLSRERPEAFIRSGDNILLGWHNAKGREIRIRPIFNDECKILVYLIKDRKLSTNESVIFVYATNAVELEYGSLSIEKEVHEDYVLNDISGKMEKGIRIHLKFNPEAKPEAKPKAKPEEIKALTELYKTVEKNFNERLNKLKKEQFSSLIEDIKSFWIRATGEAISADSVIDPQTGMLQSIEFRFPGELFKDTCKGHDPSNPGYVEAQIRFIDYAWSKLKRYTGLEVHGKALYDPKGVIFKLQEEPKQA